MIKIKLPKPLLLLSLLALNFFLVACGSDESRDSSPAQSETVNSSQPTEVSHLEQRLLIAFDDSVSLYETDDFIAIDNFSVTAPQLSAGPNERLAFLANREENSVKVLDLGVWYEDHGDHLHFYTQPPELLPYEITGEKPTHIVNHKEQSAIFFDGTGEVQVFSAAALLATELPEAELLIPDSPHHGVALPLSNGGVIRTLANDEEGLPDTLGLFTEDGDKTILTPHLKGIHGEAVGSANGHEIMAFGSEEHVGLFSEEEESLTLLALPDTEARVGRLVGDSNSPYLLSNYSSRETPALSNNALIINLAEEQLTKVDLGTPYLSGFIHDGSQQGYVLGLDGNIYVIDLVKEVVSQKINVLQPFEAPSGHGGTQPSLGLSNQGLLVTDPQAKSLLLVDLSSEELTTVATFSQKPTHLLVFN